MIEGHKLVGVNIISWVFVGLLLVQYANSNSEANDDLIIYTENYAPYNYNKNGETKGLSVDLLMEVFKRAKINKARSDIIVTSWARAYSETQRRKNTLLFTTARIPNRENLFKWAGPIGVSYMALIAKRDSSIDIETNGFNAYKFATMKHVRGEQALLSAGTDPSNIIHVNSSASAGQILARGRVDAWAYDKIISFWVLKSLGYDPQAFKVVHTFSQRDLYLAFNKQTDSALIAKIQQALDDIKQDGTLDKITARYLGIFNAEIPE